MFIVRLTNDRMRLIEYGNLKLFHAYYSFDYIYKIIQSAHDANFSHFSHEHK